MDANYSEQLIASFLRAHSIKYEVDYIVNAANGANVDFLIHFERSDVFADVKEVRDIPAKNNEIVAYKQIRSDIHKLRKKFKGIKSSLPIILITVNNSTRGFTGFTLLKSMFGDVFVDLIKSDKISLTSMHHKKRGSASFTHAQNTSISGILVFNHDDKHIFFHNPYARLPIVAKFIPNTKSYYPDINSDDSDFVEFSKLMFVSKRSCS